MNERELLNKIESLKKIKPNTEWVSLTRNDILGERKVFSFQDNLAGFLFRPRVFAGAALVLLGGLFLYSQLLLSSEQRRAEELERLAKQSELQMLSIALAELKEARAEMDRNFADLIVTKSEEEAVKIAKEIAPLLLEIDKKEGAIMGSLGVITEPDKISTGEKVASYLIADYEKRSLTEEDGVLLQLAKEAFGAGDHQEALRVVLLIGQNRELKDN